MNRSPEEDEVILPPGVPGQFDMNDIAQELDQDEFDGPVSNGKHDESSFGKKNLVPNTDFSFDLKKINKFLIKTLLLRFFCVFVVVVVFFLS